LISLAGAFTLSLSTPGMRDCFFLAAVKFAAISCFERHEIEPECTLWKRIPKKDYFFLIISWILRPLPS
jgi:hypothetical protein